MNYFDFVVDKEETHEGIEAASEDYLQRTYQRTKEERAYLLNKLSRSYC
jgi:hypothetical protein